MAPPLVLVVDDEPDLVELVTLTSLPTPADQSFHTELRQGRNEMLWAKINAPVRGPAFFAAFCICALVLVLVAVGMRETPLRKGFEESELALPDPRTPAVQR